MSDMKYVVITGAGGHLGQAFAISASKFSNCIILDKDSEKLDKIQRVNTLSMISPVTNEEKQKLLESLTVKDKIETLDNIISFYLHDVSFNNQTVQ